MFHARDGLYFERLPDGSVRVLCKRKQPGVWVSGAPVDERSFEVVLYPSTWASVVAAVSRRGDLCEVFEAALRLHEDSARVGSREIIA